METSELRAKIVSMPKVELHRHLCGSLSPATLVAAADRFGIRLPAREVEELRRLVVLDRPLRSLDEVLSRFGIFADCFTSTEAVRFFARQAVADAAADGIAYLELRFSPGFMAYRHGLPLDKVVAAVVEGTGEGRREHDIEVALLAIASREIGPEVCLETFRVAADFQPEIVGIDLAGSEDGFPPEPFRAAFDFARERGLAATVHAGEQAHPENILKAVELLHARRIGHGIQAIHRPDIMEFLAQRRVALEVSISSNYIVGAVPSVAAHPVAELMAAAIPVTLNSDDPELFGITLSSELELFARLWERSLGELVRLQEEALSFAFGPASSVGIARNRLHEWWNQA